jgi:hypothetical protein
VLPSGEFELPGDANLSKWVYLYTCQAKMRCHGQLSVTHSKAFPGRVEAGEEEVTLSPEGLRPEPFRAEKSFTEPRLARDSAAWKIFPFSSL